MTPAQIKANQALCTHRWIGSEVEKNGPHTLCANGCGYEYGQTSLYRAILDEKLKEQKKL